MTQRHPKRVKPLSSFLWGRTPFGPNRVSLSQGFVQEFDKRCNFPEDLEQDRVEARARGSGRGQLAAGEKLTELQVLGRWMILVEPTRDPLQPLAFEGAHG